jgi:signal transduction histidine kinase
MSAPDKVNILLVDDQPAKLLSYEAMLSDLGENLIKASSGREALEHLLREDITIVLMDVSMPELDGFELAEIIRQHPRYQKTAIIFVSAVRQSDLDRLKGYESGAVDYVSVPVIPQLLRAKVRVFAELYRKTRESERLTRELEDRVAERTAELEEAVQTQMKLADQLRDADQRKDEFLALLAHELRNPLAPIVNAIGVMRMDGTLGPEMQWCRDVIERQTRQLTRLVDDLLDVSRITRGKIKLRPERVDLEKVVAGAVETSRPWIDSRRHRLEIHAPGAPVVLEGDPARLTQVVANLLNNAAKFQDDGGRIELSTGRDGDFALVSVKDYGYGIPEEALKRVFELFTQGERESDRVQGGLGIGLSLVKNLVELHGGFVSAHSAGPGRGSTFIVRLPCLGEAFRAGPERSEDNGRGADEPLRVLVVDDNEDAADSLAVLLRMRGHEVLVAHDGPRALELAERENPAVVLMDLGLPGMDGYEVCRQFRERGLGVPRIIAMTGYGQERDRQRAKSAGFDAHAVKPVEFAELARLLVRE